MTIELGGRLNGQTNTTYWLMLARRVDNSTVELRTWRETSVRLDVMHCYDSEFFDAEHDGCSCLRHFFYDYRSQKCERCPQGGMCSGGWRGTVVPRRGWTKPSNPTGQRSSKPVSQSPGYSLAHITAIAGLFSFSRTSCVSSCEWESLIA